jgi:hypothetical protein
MLAPGARAWRLPLHLGARKLVAPQHVHSQAAADAAAVTAAVAAGEGDGDVTAHPAPGISPLCTLAVLFLRLPQLLEPPWSALLLFTVSPLLPYWLLLVVLVVALSPPLSGLRGESTAPFVGVTAPAVASEEGDATLGFGPGASGAGGGGRKEGPKKPSSPQSLVWQAHAA